MSVVSTDDGVIKYLGSYGIVLFQANEFGGAIHFDLQAPAAGAYYLLITPYMSPNYGAVQFSLDGKDIGESLLLNNASVKQGSVQVMGPIELQAGKHRLTGTTVKATGGQPWFSIKSVNLTREKPEQAETQAAPFIKSVEKLEASDGTTALMVRHVSGLVDRFIYAGTPAKNVTCDDVQLDGCFGHVRNDADQVAAAHLIGSSLAMPGFQMALAHGEYRGRIGRIDYEKNLVYVDAELPTDGRLDYQTVCFSNPAYSRNTAYTIYGVRREGDLSVIDLGDQRIVLGQGMLDEDPLTDTRITSLIPHDYARGLTRRGAGFFTGKLLTSADWKRQTQITHAQYGQPMTVDVVSSAGFAAGDKFYYLDLQAGDEFVIANWAALSIDETGKLQVRATDDVTLTIGDNQQQVPWSPPANPYYSPNA